MKLTKKKYKKLERRVKVLEDALVYASRFSADVEVAESPEVGVGNIRAVKEADFVGR